MNETRALLSLAMSDDPVNWELFHCYPLDDKLAALELFWNDVVDGLEWNIINFGYLETDYNFVTKLLFGRSVRTELFEVSDFEVVLNYLMLGYKIIHRIKSVSEIKCVFINYVTKHHE